MRGILGHVACFTGSDSICRELRGREKERQRTRHVRAATVRHHQFRDYGDSTLRKIWPFLWRGIQREDLHTHTYRENTSGELRVGTFAKLSSKTRATQSFLLRLLLLTAFSQNESSREDHSRPFFAFTVSRVSLERRDDLYLPPQ